MAWGWGSDQGEGYDEGLLGPVANRAARVVSWCSLTHRIPSLPGLCADPYTVRNSWPRAPAASLPPLPRLLTRMHPPPARDAPPPRFPGAQCLPALPLLRQCCSPPLQPLAQSPAPCCPLQPSVARARYPAAAVVADASVLAQLSDVPLQPRLRPPALPPVTPQALRTARASAALSPVVRARLRLRACRPGSE